jgi:dTDP-4-dehydrorhamnose reductase
MKVAIFGISGQLGSDVAAALASHQVLSIDHSRADIRDADGVAKALRDDPPDWVVNCAAMTHVERCESENLAAFEANALGAAHVAQAAAETGARLLHISTDYVFDGSRKTPYTEKDLPRPINIYGASKLAGEYAVRAREARAVIVRTSGLYGFHACRGKGTNFVETMLKRGGAGGALRVVSDEVLTPTFSVDLAAQVRVMMERDVAAGLYHATNRGACSWFEFAREIFRLKGGDVSIDAISADEWKSPVRRPRYSVLENGALAAIELDHMPEWRDALARYMAGRTHQ